MTTDFRQERTESLIKEIAGTFFAHKGEAHTLVSVTRVNFDKEKKEALLYLSIFPETRAKEILDKLKGELGKLRTEISDRAKIGLVPHLEIRLDKIDITK